MQFNVIERLVAGHDLHVAECDRRERIAFRQQLRLAEDLLLLVKSLAVRLPQRGGFVEVLGGDIERQLGVVPGASALEGVAEDAGLGALLKG